MAGVSAKEIEVHIENGVVTVTIPKAAAARPRKITVKARAEK